MDSQTVARGEVVAERAMPKETNRLDNFLYLIMGEASLANLIVMLFAISFFAATPIAMLMLFGAYSGGMRWLITLGMVAVMGFVAIFLMKRGVERRRELSEAGGPRTEFRGEMTSLTEAMARAESGYSYSQQTLRERLCEDILNKLSVIRDLDIERMNAMLDAGDAEFVGDETVARFLLENRRGTKGWDDTQYQTKGKSAERGKKFMSEIDEILKRTEAIV